MASSYNMSPYSSTLLHIVELAVAGAAAIAIAFAAHKLFGADLSAPLIACLGIVIDGLAKFARSSPDVPVTDYVNGQIR